jgi:Permuted papain-like amidase enzyme, YaeF/YiiX, C92 family
VGEGIQSIGVADLQMGDVLLSEGDSELSRAIRSLDGGRYSHAGLWAGEALIESTLPVVRCASLAEAAEHALVIDVYRHRTAERVRPAVLDAARGYLSRPYGALNLGLSTLVVALSTLMPGEWSSLNLLYGAGNLKRIAGLLRATVAAELRSPQVTCVELVGRAFSEASASLSIHLEGHGRFDALEFLKAVRGLVERMRDAEPDELEVALPATELQWLVELESSVAAGQGAPAEDPNAWQGIRRQWATDLGMEAASLPADPESPLLELSAPEIRATRLVVGRTWVPELLTPRQLERSPELELRGRIHQR